MVTCHWWQDEWWKWWWLWWRGRWRRVNDDWACQGQQAVNPPGPVNSSRWWWWLLFYGYHYHCHHHHNQHQDHQQHHRQYKKHHHDKDEYEDHTYDHDVADDAGKDVDDDSDGQGHDGSAHLGAPPPPAARNSPLPNSVLSRSMHICKELAAMCSVKHLILCSTLVQILWNGFEHKDLQFMLLRLQFLVLILKTSVLWLVVVIWIWVGGMECVARLLCPPLPPLSVMDHLAGFRMWGHLSSLHRTLH